MARPRTGTLIKRGKKGTYYLRYMLNGRMTTECLHTTIKAEAESARDKIILPLQKADETEIIQQVKQRIENKKTEEEILDEKLNPPTQLKDMWEVFLNSHNRPRSGDRTLSGYKSHQKHFQEWLHIAHPHITEIRQVTAKVAEGYADHLESLHLSPSTFNQKINALTMIWSVLAKKAKAVDNPWAWDKDTRSGIRRKSLAPEKHARRKRALTAVELSKVMNAAEGDYHTLFMILLYTGLRQVDGIKLQWDAIDFDRGVISITPQKMARRSGKQVHVPLLPPLRHELSSKIKSGKYILPDLVKRYERDSGSISKQVKKIFIAAGIETREDGKTKVGAHSFRHSFVTIARTAGIPDTVIQQITGHSSEEMVDHYTHFTKEVVANLTANLPQLGACTEPDKPDLLVVIQQLVDDMNGENWKEKRKIILECLGGKGLSQYTGLKMGQ